jgi:hypothetical protein
VPLAARLKPTVSRVKLHILNTCEKARFTLSAVLQGEEGGEGGPGEHAVLG